MTAIFDLHDQAYYTWRDAAVRREVLVHVDAHHDAAPGPEWAAIDIGNYVRAAIRADMIAAVRWIVPDPMCGDGATWRILLGELRHIGHGRLVEQPDGALTTVEGVEVWMGPLGQMPAVSGPVLLDIDVDYFLTGRYDAERSAEPLPLPWCWPEDFVGHLRSAGVVPHLTTIATSVTGGFGPLRWSHLARAIAAGLGEPQPLLLTCFASLRHAAELRESGNTRSALAACRAAVAACPGEGAAHFHLAESLQQAGQMDEARAAYRRARQLDPSYAHAFRTRGPSLYRRKRLRAADAAYREGLALDPDDSHAMLGRAMVELACRRPTAARDLAEQVVAVRPDEVDAWRTLGRARRLLGEPRAALQAYQRALSLSLRGATGLGGPWASNPERRLIDPRHWHDHAAAGDLHAGLGALDAAIAHYRIAAAGAPDVPRWRRRLAILEARMLPS